MTKVYDNAKSALADIVADGQTIAVGGGVLDCVASQRL